jgi:hypothetical protein
MGKTTPRKKFDVDKLRDNKTRNKFNITLRNRFEILGNLEPDNSNLSIDEKWKTISDLHKETCEKCLGYRRKQKSKEWITPGTWNMIDSRKEAKKKVKVVHHTKIFFYDSKQYGKLIRFQILKW